MDIVLDDHLDAETVAWLTSPDNPAVAVLTGWLALGESLSREYAARFHSRTLEIIPETWNDGILDGHASNYLRVRFPGPREKIGKIVMVTLTEAVYPIATGSILNS